MEDRFDITVELRSYTHDMKSAIGDREVISVSLNDKTIAETLFKRIRELCPQFESEEEINTRIFAEAKKTVDEMFKK